MTKQTTLRPTSRRIVTWSNYNILAKISFQLNYTTCKEIGKCDSYTEKKQARISECTQMLNVKEKRGREGDL
jgi:hypothetical protein